MDTFRKPSRTQTNQKKALEDFERAKEELKKKQDRLVKTTSINELYKYIKGHISRYNLTIEEVLDIINDIKEDLEIDINDNLDEFNDVHEDIPDNAEDTSEDEYTEVSDIEGPIDSGVCDEIVDVEFSEDGQEANNQLVKRLLEEEDVIINPRDNNKWFSIKINNKELTMENFNSGRQQYGLLTSTNFTPPSDIVNNWERFGNRKSKRKKYDFKGKNIEEVVQMIHNILG